jgi:7-cyano-7-deazaguanine synthase
MLSGRDPPVRDVAVLASGGADSAVLLAEFISAGSRVHPLYVRSDLHWEAAELAFLRRYLGAIRCPGLCPLRVLRVATRDLDPKHWAVTGRAVPAAGTPDGAVYLPGRNVLLLTKAMLWCHLSAIPALALGTLAGNPFPDATPAFFEACERLVNQAVGGAVRLLCPYAAADKAGILARGRDLPLGLTFSCLRPVAGRHCGRCNKCYERRSGFASAGLADPTEYVDGS